MEVALRSWPELVARPLEFAAHVERLSVPARDLASRGQELYLAFACSRGDAAALRILEREYLTRARRVMSRVNRSAEFLDEASQALRERLFVGENARIVQFAASGPLSAWLRIAALRSALNLQKARRNQSDLLTESLLELPAPAGADAERYRELVQSAVDAAFATLSTRERNVLRLCYIEGSSIDQIAALYGTHRSTAARWISAARGRILDQVSEVVRTKLGLSASEIQSVLVRVRSQLEISVLRLLGGDEQRDEDASVKD
jgi:RNA polymerase sigma-70 factor (ECF subfamily)